ncbi:hypothetical protein [Aliagarivorans marinus]|uniref:hypothetical protein n=1 Tax=Aliagarivorans marinus TaxID=561965 RepID=UPI000412DE57|nr:hypothetical protein [Aliagarivorans marinus]
MFPIFVSAIYFMLLASDRYVSEAQVIVKQSTNAATDFGSFGLLGATVSSGMSDAHLVRTYIYSLDMLKLLDDTHSIREHYQSRNADIVSRLWRGSAQETFLKFYRRHVSVTFDELSGVITIRVQGWESDFASGVLQSIINNAEEYINKVSHQLANEQLKFAREELDNNEAKLLAAQKEILKFQNDNSLFSPELEGGAQLSLVNNLEAELVSIASELASFKQYMSDDAPSVVSLRRKQQAVSEQLHIERQKLVGTNQNSQFNTITATYNALKLEMDFATESYKATVKAIESARVEAYQKLKHLVVVSSPSFPQRAEYPRRIYNTLSMAMLILLCYGVTKIVLATIREHKDI